MQTRQLKATYCFDRGTTIAGWHISLRLKAMAGSGQAQSRRIASTHGVEGTGIPHPLIQDFGDIPLDETFI
jgi:hypothetical protein